MLSTLDWSGEGLTDGLPMLRAVKDEPELTRLAAAAALLIMAAGCSQKDPAAEAIGRHIEFHAPADRAGELGARYRDWGERLAAGLRRWELCGAP